MNSRYSKMLQEKFGMSIGMYAGQPLIGVRDEKGAENCPICGMMPIDGNCDCSQDSCDGCGMPSSSCCCDEADVCPRCKMMPTSAGAPCGCNMTEAKKGGPSKKTAKKILKGTKTFKEKMKKVEKWADDPAAAAAWMMHKAYGRWPSEKKK